MEMLLSELRNSLGTGGGAVPSTSEIEALLAKGWHELKITSSDEKMDGWKILNRTEDLTWNPPILTFNIERHGSTVGGSIYAEVHTWSVDLERGTATLSENKRRRQLYPKDKPLKATPLAEEIAALILAGRAEQRVAWKTPSQVRLKIDEIIPATNAQTTGGRRKRFRSALQDVLRLHGWHMTKMNNFEKTQIVTPTDFSDLDRVSQ